MRGCPCWLMVRTAWPVWLPTPTSSTQWFSSAHAVAISRRWGLGQTLQYRLRSRGEDAQASLSRLGAGHCACGVRGVAPQPSALTTTSAHWPELLASYGSGDSQQICRGASLPGEQGPWLSHHGWVISQMSEGITVDVIPFGLLSPHGHWGCSATATSVPGLGLA